LRARLRCLGSGGWAPALATASARAATAMALVLKGLIGCLPHHIDVPAPIDDTQALLQVATRAGFPYSDRVRLLAADPPTSRNLITDQPTAKPRCRVLPNIALPVRRGA